MKQRRAIGAALNVSPEHLAFIKGGPPAAPSAPAETPIVNRVIQVPAEETAPETAPSDESEPQADVSPASSTRRSRPRAPRRAPHEAEEPMPAMGQILVPLTTRLSPATAAALKRAGLEQKLYGRKPSTVQEIAETAIRTWLDREGYL